MCLILRVERISYAPASQYSVVGSTELINLARVDDLQVPRYLHLNFGPTRD